MFKDPFFSDFESPANPTNAQKKHSKHGNYDDFLEQKANKIAKKLRH